MSRMRKNIPLQHAIIDVFREQLRLRYLPGNCRRFVALKPISDETLAALRDFFLESIYPPAANRERLDDAFDRAGAIIRSPRRMAPLMAIAVRSVWTLGSRFSAAAAAGRNALDAYIETRKIEDRLLEFAEKHEVAPAQIGEHEHMVRMIASLPENEMLAFRGETLKLFERLSNVKLLEAAVEIMSKAKGPMASRPDLYSEQDIAGFTLGLDVIARGLDLFRSLKEPEVPAIIRGIEAVESDWYDRIKAEAAAWDAGA